MNPDEAADFVSMRTAAVLKLKAFLDEHEDS